MPNLFQQALQIFKKASESDAYLFNTIYNITGLRPKNLQLYRLAVSHTSLAKEMDGIKYSNERLEYLGDAVLGAIIADYLFKKYPFKDEGFLTEIRSRIVNRESLNELGKIIGLNKIVEHAGAKQHFRVTSKSLYGDALEAIVGAVYLDQGFKKCKIFILKVLLPNFNLEEIVNSHKNFKSILIEYVQKENKFVKFVVISEQAYNNVKQFTSQVVINDEPICLGMGYSKKKSEQAAAEKACELLKII